MAMLIRKPNDIDDIKRVQDIDRDYQKKVRRHGTAPNLKQVEDLQLVVFDDSGTTKLGIRSKGKLYEVTLTER